MLIEERVFNHLREKICARFGRKIATATDCEALSHTLQRELALSVSTQSLRRFFGLIKHSGGFSTYTKNALAAYCGFQDFDTCKENLLQNDIYSFFQQTTEDIDGRDLWNLSEALCMSISQSPTLLMSVHQDFLSYPPARKYFIEHHPMRDLACTPYAQYFHEYLKYSRDNEAKLFAYGFLFMGAFLSENAEMMELYFNRVTQTELTPEVYVLPAARKLGVALLYADFTDNNRLFNKWWKKMLDARDGYKKASERSVCSFEYAVLEHLIFTERYAEIRFLIDTKTAQKFSDKSFVPDHRKENHEEIWKIMCAYAYVRMGERQSAKALFKAVDLKKLTVGWRKYYSILYWLTALLLQEESQGFDIKYTLEKLIKETRFSFYDAVLQESVPATATSTH